MSAISQTATEMGAKTKFVHKGKWAHLFLHFSDSSATAVVKASLCST